MKRVWLLFHLFLLLLFHLGRFLHKPRQIGFRHEFQHVAYHRMRTKAKHQAQSTSTQSTKRTTTSHVYFRTEALRVQGLGMKCVYIYISINIFFSQLNKHCNFGLKQNGRKSKSLTAGEALQTPVSRTLMQALGTRVQEGSPGEYRRGCISPPTPDISLGELGWEWGWGKSYKALGPSGRLLLS